MSHPIDIIANAIRTADGNHTLGAGRLAEVAANALTFSEVVDNAAQALRDAGYDEHLDSDQLRHAAVVALRSVAGE